MADPVDPRAALKAPPNRHDGLLINAATIAVSAWGQDIIEDAVLAIEASAPGAQRKHPYIGPVVRRAEEYVDIWRRDYRSSADLCGARLRLDQALVACCRWRLGELLAKGEPTNA